MFFAEHYLKMAIDLAKLLMSSVVKHSWIIDEHARSAFTSVRWLELLLAHPCINVRSSVTTPHFHKCQGEPMKKAKNSQGFGKAMIIENI